MYACICARVLDCELRAVIRRGADDEDAVAQACGAGIGCGTCLERIDHVIAQETDADTLAGATR